MLIFGTVRIGPIIVNETNEIEFNYKLSYLANPFQEWFFDKSWIEFLCNAKYHTFLNAEAMKLTPFIEEWKQKMDFTNVVNYLKNSPCIDENIYDYCRLVSTIIRLHPSEDFSLIIGLITASIENILKINGENRYKFAIKISNLIGEKELFKTMQHVYDKRSDFFHSAVYKSMQDAGEETVIYFLFIVCSKLLIFKNNNKIDQESFNFSI